MGAAEATLALRRDASRVALRELRALLAAPEGQGWRYALRALASGGKDPALSAQLLGRLMDEGAIPDNLQAWLMFAGLAQQLDQPDLAERIQVSLLNVMEERDIQVRGYTLRLPLEGGAPCTAL